MARILEGKTIIVTGTAKGMGHEMVATFAKNGANVYALARSESADHKTFCESVASDNGVSVNPFYFDLTNADEMKGFVKLVRNEKPNIDGLVNNAGVTVTALFQMTREEDIRRIYETNVFSLMMFTQY